MYYKSEKYFLYKIEEWKNKVLYRPVAIIQFNDTRAECMNLVSFNEFKILVDEFENIDLVHLLFYYKNEDKKEDEEFKTGINLYYFYLTPIVSESPEDFFKQEKEEYLDEKLKLSLIDELGEI